MSYLKPDIVATAPAPRLGFRGAVASLRSEPAHARVLGGSIIMLLGSVLVSVFNFGYNVAVARLLGPSAFGHAAAVGTLLMLVSAITLSFQLVAAKFIARSESEEERAYVYSAMLRRAWRVGLILGSTLTLASGFVADYLNLPSRWLVIILAIGLAFYVPLGTKRGGLQGTCRFRHLSWNLILETVVKLLGAVVFIAMGYGVEGAVAAVSASVILAYFLPLAPLELKARKKQAVQVSFGEGIQAIVFFTGQVVINNVDILLVKHFFPPDQAGLYAAIALVGRVLYLAAWSVVSAMFPVSAGADPEDENSSVLVVPLVIVLFISLAFIIGLGAFPEPVLRATFGSSFQMDPGMYALLSMRAAATGTYCLAVVLMAYEISRKIANTGWIQLAMSGAIAVGLEFFHSDLRQVVVVQLVLMVLLLMIVSLPFFKSQFRRSSVLEEAA
jgi:O-antigen/teichoic acid export membrane protein